MEDTILRAPFSFNPTASTRGSTILRQQLFCSDPWSLMKSSLKSTDKKQKLEISSYIDQGKAFYQAGQKSDSITSKPLLYYYAFLNLFKACIINSGQALTYNAAYHGIADSIAKNALDLELTIHCTNGTGSKPNILEDFWKYSFGPATLQIPKFKLKEILSQILSSHRVHQEISRKRDQFIPINDIYFSHEKRHKKVWIEFDIHKEDIEQIKLNPKTLLNKAGLNNLFTTNINNEYISCIQNSKYTYQSSAQEKYLDLSKMIKQKIWQSVLSIPPYRRYYLFTPQTNTFILPQTISTYVVFFALSSIVRYRPLQLLESTEMIPWFEEFLSSSPGQLLYSVASEFMKTDLSKPAII